tara:strand:- start:440 stop:643 length:204 start_codon:yes stop_codon:yes gene_type:complete
MNKKTLYTEIGEDNIGLIYADPENQRKGLGGIIADFTIVDAPNDLKSEIGCFVTLPLNQMKIYKKAK